MDHFVEATANYRQWTQYPSLSQSAVNAIALAGGIPWEEAYELLLRQCERYGLLPHYRDVILDTLRSAGYARLSPSPKLENYTALSEYMAEHYPRITHALILTSRGCGMGDQRVCAVRRAKQEKDGFNVLDLREEKRNILSLWLPWREAGLPEPLLKAPAAEPEYRPAEAHPGYLPFQPNPRQKNTGDCVIRAYAAVFDVSWSEAIHMLARSCEYCSTKLNGAHMYAYLTSEYGFVYHDRMTRDGRGLTGAEFCREMEAVCRNGERIFAKIGADHVAGIIPVKESGKIRYVVADSWDSSRKKIGGYWVYRPSAAEKKAAPAEERNPDPVVSLREGDCIIHPVFGPGRICGTDEPSQMLTVSFRSVGKKLLGSSWVRAHCRQGEPSGGKAPET